MNKTTRNDNTKVKSKKTDDKTGARKNTASSSSRDTPVKSKSSAGAAKYSISENVNTVDYAIKKKHIFKATWKVPKKVLKVLYKDGWIWKRSTERRKKYKWKAPKVLSKHKNAERVRNVVKIYDVGLILTSRYSGGVKWFSLKPDVIVNRFPRNGYARLKLCNQALAGNAEYNEFFPRTYPAVPRNPQVLATADNCFEGDYSLTACVSLIRAFVDPNNRNIAKSSKKFGKVPLSALHFAMDKCNEYVSPHRNQRSDLSGKGKAWDEFFGHYHRVMDDYEQFMAPPSDDMMPRLKTFCKQLIEKVIKLRPQTAIDGYNNMWVVKTEQTAFGDTTAVLNRFSDIMKWRPLNNGGGGRSRRCKYVVQKYIETPMLDDRYKMDLQTWLVVSTLDQCLTVWLYNKCSMQSGLNRYTTELMPNEFVHLVNSKINRPAIFRRAKTCSVKFLKSRLRSIKSYGCNSHSSVNNDGSKCNQAVYSIIRKSVIKSVLAAGTAGVLHLRPNCIEIFQATFAMAEDRRPWLIDIKSDPYQTHAFYVDVTAIDKAVSVGLIKILVAKNRATRTKVAGFEAIYRGSIPGPAYKPRAFVEKTVPRQKRDRTWPKSEVEITDDDDYNYWNEDISTYIETIGPDDVEDDDNPTIPIGAKSTVIRELMQTLARKPPSVDELRELMARFKNGSIIDKEAGQRCLQLLDIWKTRIRSAQHLYLQIRRGQDNKLQKM